MRLAAAHRDTTRCAAQRLAPGLVQQDLIAVARIEPGGFVVEAGGAFAAGDRQGGTCPVVRGSLRRDQRFSRLAEHQQFDLVQAFGEGAGCEQAEQQGDQVQ